jgi:ATP synthase protein I
MERKPRPSSLSLMEAVGVLSGMGFVIAVPIVVFAIVGHYLDGVIHTQPFLLLLGLLLGLVTGIVGAYRLYKSVFNK